MVEMTAPFPVTGRIAVLAEDDVDTDVIYPARFLLLTCKTGLGRHAFADRREAADFPLPLDGSATILVAGRNFGSGSSREHAVWALADFGVRVVIAPSFGEIFYANCARNGVLPIRLDEEQVAGIMRLGGQSLTVDLAAQRIEGDGGADILFDIAPGAREALLQGWDETTRILNLHGTAIARFEQAQRAESPWLWSNDSPSGAVDPVPG